LTGSNSKQEHQTNTLILGPPDSPSSVENLGFFSRLPREIRDHMFSFVPDDERPFVGSKCLPLALRSVSQSFGKDQHRTQRECKHTEFALPDLGTSEERHHLDTMARWLSGEDGDDTHIHSFPENTTRTLVLTGDCRNHPC
jgi:hypothetical protein